MKIGLVLTMEVFDSASSFSFLIF